MNIPNALTLFRILLTPVIVLVYHHHGVLWCALVLFVAYLTDFLDGYIARHTNQVTDLGKLLDPLADKLLMAAILLCMFDAGRVPVWCLCVMLGQALYLIAGSALLVKKRGIINASNVWGKSATALFFASALCLFPNYPWAWVESAGKLFLCCALFLMLCAAASYTKIALEKVKEQENALDK